MSTKLHDVGSHAVVESSIPPSTLFGTATGVAVDLGDGDGTGFAVLSVGGVSDGGSLTGQLQESADVTVWTTVAGVTFDPITAENATQVRSFVRTKRYVRMIATVAGADPTIEFVGLIGQQKKTV